VPAGWLCRVHSLVLQTLVVGPQPCITRQALRVCWLQHDSSPKRPQHGCLTSQRQLRLLSKAQDLSTNHACCCCKEVDG
jgi:hypothetical protein